MEIDGNTEESETFAQVKSRTTKVALGMKKLGFKPKEIVLICCNSGINNIIPVLATLYLGGCVSSADPKQSSSDIRYLLSLLLPKMIFVEQDSVELIQNSLVGLDLTPCIIVIGNSDKYPTLKSLEKSYDEENLFRPVPQELTDIAFIMFTSGTTSSPKGIKISNKYALDTGFRSFERGIPKPGVIIYFSSFHWISTLFYTNSNAIVTGSTVVTGKDLSPERFLYLTEKYKITFAFMTNSYTYGISSLNKEIINKYDTSSLNALAMGGIIVDPVQLLKLRELLPYTKVCIGYGATETNAISGFGRFDQEAYENKIESSGTLSHGVEIKVVDLTTRQLLGPNQEGEIRVKSPSLMSGYYNLETNNAFDEDGFFKIGDLGYYDQDDYIYVTGRVSETFLYQTTPINPSAIENVILSHPAVAAAVVFGVKHLVDNNHPGALVAFKPNSNVDVKDLLDYINERVSNNQRLRAGILVVNNIPKTPSGKIQRRTIKEIFKIVEG